MNLRWYRGSAASRAYLYNALAHRHTPGLLDALYYPLNLQRKNGSTQPGAEVCARWDKNGRKKHWLNRLGEEEGEVLQCKPPVEKEAGFGRLGCVTAFLGEHWHRHDIGGRRWHLLTPARPLGLVRFMSHLGSS